MQTEFVKSTNKFLSVIDETNTPNLEKIFTVSDIHGDILPLIVQLRDCAKVIKRKRTKVNFYKNLVQDIQSDYSLKNELDETLDTQYMSQETLENDIMLKKNFSDPKYERDLGYEWVSPNTILVVIGDILDNFRQGDTKIMESDVKSDEDDFTSRKLDKRFGEYINEELKIVSFLQEMHAQALNYQSRVIILSGNHEVMNMVESLSENITRYNSEFNMNILTYDQEKVNHFKKNNPLEYVSNDKTTSSRKELFSPGHVGNVMFNKYNNFGLMVKIYDYIFIHGGFNFKTSSINISIEKMNELFLQIVRDGKIQSHEPDFDTVWDIVVADSTSGILWERKLASTAEINEVHTKKTLSTFCHNLRIVLENLCENTLKSNNDTKDRHCSKELKIVVGHCIQSDVGNTNVKNTTYGNLIEYDEFIEKLGKPVVVGSTNKLPDEINEGGILFGITMECDRPDVDNPALYRIDHSPSRCFDFIKTHEILIREYNRRNLINYMDEQLKESCAQMIISLDYMRRLPQVLNINLKGDNYIIRSSLKNMAKNVPRSYHPYVKRILERFIDDDTYDAMSQFIPNAKKNKNLEKKIQILQEIERKREAERKWEEQKLIEKNERMKEEQEKYNKNFFLRAMDQDPTIPFDFQVGGADKNIDEKDRIIIRLKNKLQEYRQKYGII